MPPYTTMISTSSFPLNQKKNIEFTNHSSSCYSSCFDERFSDCVDFSIRSFPSRVPSRYRKVTTHQTVTAPKIHAFLSCISVCVLREHLLPDTFKALVPTDVHTQYCSHDALLLRSLSDVLFRSSGFCDDHACAGRSMCALASLTLCVQDPT